MKDKAEAPAASSPEYCDRCDGCGWYEGGQTIKTTCERCGGTGVVASVNAPGAASSPDALVVLRELFGFVESGDLMRNAARDDQPGWASWAMSLVMTLKRAQELVGASDRPPAGPSSSLSVLADAGQGKQEAATRGTSNPEEG